jgi:RNA polymerase sigma-70 factor (ECF subfamily)
MVPSGIHTSRWVAVSAMHTREAQSSHVRELVARARSGDREAFDGLVETYAPQVFNIALRITGSREEAEDCVQEAFLRAFSALRKFRGEAAFSTWLYRVTVNVANDAARRLSGRPLAASELAGAASDEDAPDLERLGRPTQTGTPGPEEALVERQRREVVLAAVRRLPEHHRTVVVLYDIQGLSYDEIARITGTRVGTVKSRLNRARIALKDLLADHLELLRG